MKKAIAEKAMENSQILASSLCQVYDLLGEDSPLPKISVSRGLSKPSVDDARASLLGLYEARPGLFDKNADAIDQLHQAYAIKRRKPPTVMFPKGIPWAVESDSSLLIGDDIVMDRSNPDSVALFQYWLDCAVYGKERADSSVSSSRSYSLGTQWPGGKVYYRLENVSTYAAAFRAACANWENAGGLKGNGTMVLQFIEVADTKTNRNLYNRGLKYHVRVDVVGSPLGPSFFATRFQGYGAGQAIDVSTNANTWSYSYLVTAFTHELGHVLSLGHEHQRIDRDSYVHVAWSNIPSGYATQFAIIPLFSSLSYHYDMASIMHYPATDGVSPYFFTDTKGNPIYDTGGQTKISIYDADWIHTIYTF